MALLGTLNSVAITTPSGISITNIVSGSVNPSVEVLERHYQKAFPQITLGNMNLTTSVVCTDASATGLVQGMKVGGVTFTFNGVQTTIDPDDLTTTGNGDTLAYVVSDMYVQDVVAVEADNEGKSVIQYTVTLKACCDETGDAPTITKTFTAGV